MQIAPYMSDRRRKRKRMRAYLFTALGILVLYGIFFVTQWFILHSPVFRVDRVVVAGNSSVASSDVIALAETAAAPRAHLFRAAMTFNNMLLWPDTLASSDLATVPQLASATIAKDYFSHTVTITATQRSPIGIWCFSGKDAAAGGGANASSGIAVAAGASCYWFDNTGTLFQKADTTQGNLVFVVYDSAQKPQGLDQKILPPEFLSNFLSVVNVLKESGLGVRSIDLSDLALEEVDVDLASGPTIYFSLQFPSDEYLPVIQKLMLQPNFNDLQYIDCRTQNRLFYK
ncbi:MAG TPA: hypothetical protein VMA75_04205 [Candidatus Paceibacterota bacterium]|nr:hypothetical protein [Candidatus Paceibacterota bacterium]